MHSTEETGVLGWDHLPSWEQGRIHTNSYLSGIFFWFLGFCVRHWTPLNELTKIALILLMLFPPCSALPILQAGPGFPPVNTRDQEMAVGFLTAGSQVSCASALSVLMTLLWMRFTYPEVSMHHRDPSTKLNYSTFLVLMGFVLSISLSSVVNLNWAYTLGSWRKAQFTCLCYSLGFFIDPVLLF